MFDSHIIDQLGWALVHSVWQIALIAYAVAICNRTVFRKSASGRYITGCTGLLLAFFALAITFVVSESYQVSTPDFASIATDDLTSGGRSNEMLPAPVNSPRQTEVAPANVMAQAESPDLSPAVIAPPVPSESQDFGRADSESLVFGSWKDRLASSLEPAIPWIVAVWLAGVLLLCFRPLSGLFTVWRIRRRGRSEVNEKIVAIVARLCDRMGISRAIEVAQTAWLEVPAVVGVMRPLLLLPAAAIAGLTPQQLEAIIAHELAHIRRHDFLVNVLQTVVETLLFYHPAVWWISHRVRQERENICDDIAISVCGDPAGYSHALVELESLRRGPQIIVAANSGGSLLQRIRRIVRGEPTQSWSVWSALLVLLFTVCIGGGVIWSSGGMPSVSADETEVNADEQDDPPEPNIDQFPALNSVPIVEPDLRLKQPFDGFVSHLDVAWSPDGNRLLGVNRGTASIWGSKLGRLMSETQPPSGATNSIAVSAGKPMAVIGTNTCKVDLLNLESGMYEQTFPIGPEYSIYAVALSRDATRLASCAANGTIAVWDVPQKRLLWTLGDKGGPTMQRLAFSPDGSRLASIDHDSRPKVWDMATGRKLAERKPIGCEQLSFSPDGSTVAIALSQSLHFWDWQSDTERVVRIPDEIDAEKRQRKLNRLSSGFLTSVYKSELSADHRMAATIVQSKWIVVWNVETRKLMYRLRIESPMDIVGGGINRFRFSPSGQRIAAGRRDGKIAVWSLPQKDRNDQMKASYKAIHSGDLDAVKEQLPYMEKAIIGNYVLWPQHLDVFELLSRHADPQSLTHHDAIKATVYGDRDALERWIKKEGASGKTLDALGLAQLAAMHNRPKIIKILAKHGANLDSFLNPSRLTALSFAAEAGNIEAIETLVSLGCDVSLLADYTPLQRACCGRQPEAAARLLKHGADPNTARHDGQTALHLAAKVGAIDCIDLLLKHGADPNSLAHGSLALRPKHKPTLFDLNSCCENAKFVVVGKLSGTRLTVAKELSPARLGATTEVNSDWAAQLRLSMGKKADDDIEVVAFLDEKKRLAQGLAGLVGLSNDDVYLVHENGRHAERWYVPYESYRGLTRRKFLEATKSAIALTAERRRIADQPPSAKRAKQLLNLLEKQNRSAKELPLPSVWPHHHTRKVAQALSPINAKEEHVLLNALREANTENHQITLLRLIADSSCSRRAFQPVSKWISPEFASGVRSAAITAITRLDNYSAADQITRLLKFDDPNLRELLQGLSTHGRSSNEWVRNPRALPALERLSKQALAQQQAARRRTDTEGDLPANQKLSDSGRGLGRELSSLSGELSEVANCRSIGNAMRAYLHPMLVPSLMDWVDSGLPDYVGAKSILHGDIGLTIDDKDSTSIRQWWARERAVLEKHYDLSAPGGVDAWLESFPSADVHAKKLLSRLWLFEPSIAEDHLLQRALSPTDPQSPAASKLLADLWKHGQLSASCRESIVASFLKIKLIELDHPGIKDGSRELQIVGTSSFQFPESASVDIGSSIAIGREPKQPSDSTGSRSLHHEKQITLGSIGGGQHPGAPTAKAILVLREYDYQRDKIIWEQQWQLKPLKLKDSAK